MNPPGTVSEDFDEGLREEEARLDACRTLLIELMHLISVYFRGIQYWEKAKEEEDHFHALTAILHYLSQMPDHDGAVLLRFRGISSGPTMPADTDYVIRFGNLVLDFDVIPGIVKRQGTRAAHLGGRLRRAFEMFAGKGINNIHTKVMAENPASLDRLLISLRILSRYHQALETDAPIVFEKNNVEVSLPICVDEQKT